MYHNIPLELRSAPRWCFTGREVDGGMAKAPFALTCGHFQPLDTTKDYHLCMTFEEIEPLLSQYPDRDIGFVLVDGDGYTCVDLDVKDITPVDATARHAALIDGLDTYTEASQSGCGVHMWLRGEINGAIKTSEMEVYSRERFIICTGNVIRDLPIAYDPDVIDFFNIRSKESAATFDFVDAPQISTDQEVLDMCYGSDHSGKFYALMAGDWDKYTNIMHEQGSRDFTFDASQADAAFMTIVTYYTRNVDQCKRLWRMSALANVQTRYPGDPKEQRKKAKNLGTDYKLMRAIGYGIRKNDQDKERNAIMIAEGRARAEELLANTKATSSGTRLAPGASEYTGKLPDVPEVLEYPPGMMGELARYFYRASKKPIREFAIAEALALAAGLFGRCYNISGTGLNQYIMVLAASGTGKSALSKNPENLMNYLERQQGVINARQFVMSKRFTHENAMFQEFKERSSFVQCLSEFGKIFRNMVSETNGGGALATVRECMTDIYSKSGAFDVAGGMRYATSERSVDLGYPVAYSFLGESVPEPFFESVTPDMFSDGFMSRMILMEYEGVIPYDNDCLERTPPAHIVEHLTAATLGVSRALMDINVVTVCNVQMIPEAEAWFARFNRHCTDQINASLDDAVWNALWSRTNLKILKLAGLIATMDCPSQPVVTMQHVNWAHDFVMRHNHLIVSSIANGRMSAATGHEGMNAIRDVMLKYMSTPFDDLPAIGLASLEAMHAQHVVPWAYIQRIAARRSAFRNHKFKSANQLMKEAVSDLMEAGVVRKLSEKESVELYKTRGSLYQLLG